MSGKTLLYDKSTGRCYIGSFRPTHGHTAHQMLAYKAGIKSLSTCVGGSVKKVNGQWTMGQRSESLNYMNFGKCKVHGNALVGAKKALSSGGYYTVSQAGSVNKGVKHYW